MQKKAEWFKRKRVGGEINCISVVLAFGKGSDLEQCRIGAAGRQPLAHGYMVVCMPVL